MERIGHLFLCLLSLIAYIVFFPVMLLIYAIKYLSVVIAVVLVVSGVVLPLLGYYVKGMKGFDCFIGFVGMFGLAGAMLGINKWVLAFVPLANRIDFLRVHICANWLEFLNRRLNDFYDKNWVDRAYRRRYPNQ